MQPLVDADVLRYEVGFGVETGWEGAGYAPFDYAAEMLDNRIANICALVEATQPPILYLTEGKNFRNDIAKKTPYKQRAGEKPFHFKNLTAYMKAKYDTRSCDGLEADDLMAIEQCSRGGDTIICTRDKDLRQVPGMAFAWELGNQPQYGPTLIEEFGKLSLSEDRKKLRGEGLLFFYSQCLTGDAVDSIPGLPRCGPVKAFETLQATKTPTDAFKAVLEAYRVFYGDSGDEELLEQGRLLWMTRKLNPDGSPVLWGFPSDS